MLKSFYDTTKIEAGCDEAGRGCLAGPVVAAAVIFPKKYKNNMLNDSKKLSKKQRENILAVIKQDAISWSIASVEHDEIDKINILHASFLAMSKAVQSLSLQPELLLIDGNRFSSSLNIPYTCIVKGDSTYLSIAAASVLAKTYRDELMQNLHQKFPYYSWNKNMGYPTLEHRKAIEQYGISPFHRKTFQLLKKQLEFNF